MNQHTGDIATLNAAPTVSIIIPTLNERGNIDPLLSQIEKTVTTSNFPVEIIFVDGGSKDGTYEYLSQLAKAGRIRSFQTNGKGGLSKDVLFAAQRAKGNIVAVMDADLSHPADKLNELISPVVNGKCDFCIGSRYIPGGATPEWPWYRRMTSRGASLLAKPFVDVSDPMSGFFATKKSIMLELGQEATGFKIGMEILVRGNDSLRVHEIPIIFHDRYAGNSKFGLKEIVIYLRQLMRLAGGNISMSNGVRFGVVGILGFIVDFSLFNLLMSIGAGRVISNATAFIAATIFNFILNGSWAFAKNPAKKLRFKEGYFAYLVLCVMAFILRSGILANAMDNAHMPYWQAIMIAIFAGAVVNYIGTAFFIFPDRSTRPTANILWRVFALAMIAYSIALRLFYGDIMHLLPEEAYYWNYAYHLDYGYLDHPPMVAWLISASRFVFGDNEFAIRLPAMLLWFGTGAFIYKLAKEYFGKTVAFCSIALLACLPVFLLTGFFMTPDAPMYFFWTACIYYMSKIFIKGSTRSWYAVGITMGLGLLSKYTIALLGGSCLCYMLMAKDAKHWFKRKEPYLAVLIAMAIFSPVIIWNAQNNWASFEFQTLRRVNGSFEFGLPKLIGVALFLITPLGLTECMAALFPSKKMSKRFFSGKINQLQKLKFFATIFVFTSATVFVLFSLSHNPKTNWLGPIFLPALPFMAWGMVYSGQFPASRNFRLVNALWKPTLVTCTLGLGIAVYMLTMGTMAIGPAEKLRTYGPSAWKEVSESIEHVRANAGNLGPRPIIVSVDKYFMPSELAFYSSPEENGQPRVAGRGFFPEIFSGDLGLMWNIWVNMQDYLGKDIFLVDFERSHIEKPWLENYFESMSPVQRQAVEKDGKTVCYYYWRIGHNYSKFHANEELRVSIKPETGDDVK